MIENSIEVPVKRVCNLPSAVFNDKIINRIIVPPELADLSQFYSNLTESVIFERFFQNWQISKGNPPDLTEVSSKIDK